MSNHTSTHILNFALKKVLGEEVDQKGSLVDPKKLRFDFSCRRRLTEQDLHQIEQICMQQISAKLNVHSKVVSLKEAMSIHGLRAVFGEKYPDPVRVVSIGIPIQDLLNNPSDPNNANFAVELCGGTHLANTQEAGVLYIISESSPSAGIIRIVAVTGSEAESAKFRGEQLLKRVEHAQTLSGDKLAQELKFLLVQSAELDLPALLHKKIDSIISQLTKSKHQHKKGTLESSVDKAKQLALECTEQSVKYIVHDLDIGGNKKGVNNAAKIFGEANSVTAACFISKDEETVYINCVVPSSQVGKIKAGEWANAVSALLGGKGGGKPTFAAGNGKEVSKFDEALEFAKKYASERLDK